jgi:hypothetical protein
MYIRLETNTTLLYKNYVAIVMPIFASLMAAASAQISTAQAANTAI